jgi:hypothetical protein
MLIPLFWQRKKFGFSIRAGQYLNRGGTSLSLARTSDFSAWAADFRGHKERVLTVYVGPPKPDKTFKSHDITDQCPSFAIKNRLRYE